MATSDYTSEIPYGYCHCGCGQKTRIATANNTQYGHIKGEPVRYINHHSSKYTPEQAIKEFWSKVNKDGSIPTHMPHLGKCWEWLGSKHYRGYGDVRWNGRKDKAHRAAWQIVNGDISDGLCVLHKCDNPSCCNPKHLFLGTQKQNAEDRESKNRGNRINVTGEKHGMHKLTDKQVNEIRQRYAAGGITQRKIAAEYGVKQGTICDIVRRANWKHI